MKTLIKAFLGTLFLFGGAYCQQDSAIVLEVREGNYIITSHSSLKNKTGADTSMHPMPFGPTTKYRFTIKETSSLTFDISDTNYISFLKIKLNAVNDGEYSIDIFDFNKDMPSGIYYVSIITDSETTRKKIVIVK